jgi:hypothetical protein
VSLPRARSVRSNPMTAAFRLHERAAAKRVRRGAQLNGPITVIRVAPEAMRVALRLADGDASRIRIISARCVLVANQPARVSGAPYGPGRAGPVGQLGR